MCSIDGKVLDKILEDIDNMSDYDLEKALDDAHPSGIWYAINGVMDKGETL